MMPESIQMHIPEDVVVLISVIPGELSRRAVNTMYIRLREAGYSFAAAKEAVVRVVQQADDMGNVQANTLTPYVREFVAEMLDAAEVAVNRTVAELPHQDYLPARVVDVRDRLKGDAEPDRCLTIADKRRLARAVTAGMQDSDIYFAVIALLGPAIANVAGVDPDDRDVLLKFLEG